MRTEACLTDIGAMECKSIMRLPVSNSFQNQNLEEGNTVMALNAKADKRNLSVVECNM